MLEEYDDFDESQKFNKWWNPLTWSPWIKYILTILFVAVFAWNSSSPSSVIITAIILWVLIVSPKFVSQKIEQMRAAYANKAVTDEIAKKAERSTLTVREEQIFQQLTDDLFDK